MTTATIEWACLKAADIRKLATRGAVAIVPIGSVSGDMEN